MTWNSDIRAVIFDYGNTIVQFGAAEIARCDRALADALERRFGPPDRARLAAIRARDRLAPYAGTPPAYRENDLRAITRAAVRELYGLEPAKADLDALVRVRFEAFVDAVRAPDDVIGPLDRLAARFPLGLLSNYPDGDAIRESLRRTGLARRFGAVVVSADVGLVKPHPRPFEIVLDRLGLPARAVAFVGDNWLADVQGAKRAGLTAVWFRRWDAPEAFPPRDGDHPPDHHAASLADICALAGC